MTPEEAFTQPTEGENPPPAMFVLQPAFSLHGNRLLHWPTEQSQQA